MVNDLISQHEGAGSNPSWTLFVWSFPVLPERIWVFSRNSDFLSQFKCMLHRLIGDSKLSVGENVWLCGPVTDWHPVQDVSRLRPTGAGLAPATPKGIQPVLKMDGWDF